MVSIVVGWAICIGNAIFHGASYPRIFLKAIHMEVARRKVGDYYETEEKLTV